MNVIKDEMEAYAKRAFGKPYDQLTEKQKDKAYFWAKDIVRSRKE